MTGWRFRERPGLRSRRSESELPGRRASQRYRALVEIAQFRARMPLIAFILLALICLLMFGFACACLSDQPALALERALQSPALLTLIVAWASIVLGGFMRTLPRLAVVAHPGRGSPELLQRFLF